MKVFTRWVVACWNLKVLSALHSTEQTSEWQHPVLLLPWFETSLLCHHPFFWQNFKVLPGSSARQRPEQSEWNELQYSFQLHSCLSSKWCSCYRCLCTLGTLFLFPLQKLTLRRAQEQSLQTARLPIREYMVKAVNTKNYHSETLAINQGEGLSHVLSCAWVGKVNRLWESI